MKQLALRSARFAAWYRSVGFAIGVGGAAIVFLSWTLEGSVNYIAPEMEAGWHGLASSAVDVYALGKVLYWMLSGGRIFAREDHRAPSQHLARVLRDQRFEHVHALLDHMIVERATGRWDLGKVREWLTILIENRFTPLRPSMGLRCRFCGLGEYRQHARVQS